jgi:DNA gyrase subunit A
MATVHGTVKRTDLDQFRNVRRNGIRAITLDEGDELAWVKVAEGHEDVMLITRNGQAVRFDLETQVRSTGRGAAGVRGIRLKADDAVIRMDLILSPDDEVLIVTENGYGKRTPLKEYRVTARGGLGVTATKVTPKTGKVVGARVAGDSDAEAILMSAEGLITRTDVKSIRETGRASQGVIVMRLNKGDKLVSMATLNASTFQEIND